MAFFPTGEEARDFTNINAIVSWVGLNVLVVPAIEKHTGAFSDLPRNMALLPPIVIKEAVKVAKLTEAGEERLLTPVEAAQIGLVWRITRRKLSENWANWADIDPFEDTGGAATHSSKESGGNAYVKRKEVEDGARFRPGRRIRVYSRGRWTHQQVVPQFCRDNAWPTRRRGNADERTIIGVKREGGCSTGFSVRGFRCLHALRSEDLQSSPLHCLLASAGRVLACEGNPRPFQLSSLALLLASLSGGLSDVESGACDASGPLPTENREVGYAMAYGLAPGLSSGRQMQVRTLQPAEVADRVRHRSRSARSAVVGCGVSLVSHFLEGSRGRRVLLGRQHSAPRDELAGTWKQRGSQSTRASGCGGHARWRCGGARSGNVASSGSRVHMGPRLFKQSENASEQEGTVSSTTKRGQERIRNSAGKETKRQGRRQGRKEQSTPPSRPSRDAIMSQLEFWWWDVRRPCGRKLVPGGQSSQMRDVPVGQASGNTLSTVLTRQGEGRDQDSRIGVQSRWRNFTAGSRKQDSCSSFSSCV